MAYFTASVTVRHTWLAWLSQQILFWHRHLQGQDSIKINNCSKPISYYNIWSKVQMSHIHPQKWTGYRLVSMFTSWPWMHGITSRAYGTLATTKLSCTWSNEELFGLITACRPCGSQLHHSLAPPSLTNGLEHKIKKCWQLHSALFSTGSSMLQNSPPNRLSIQPYYPHASWWHQLASDPPLPEGQTINQAGRGTIMLISRTAGASCPTAQCYELEGYHHSQSCWDTPLPIHGWLHTVHCGVQNGTFTGFSIRLDIPSHLVQHTVFTLGLQPPLSLPWQCYIQNPIKSSNLGIGEAK